MPRTHPPTPIRVSVPTRCRPLALVVLVVASFAVPGHAASPALARIPAWASAPDPTLTDTAPIDTRTTGTGSATPWTEAPLETHGDGHRVREGHIATPAAIAADALEAANGQVVGSTPAHAALLRADSTRPSGAPGTPGTAGDPSVPSGRDGYREATWIADVGVLLRGDGDGDRYFSSVELSIDVDTESVEREVYATIELTERDGTPTLVHTTRNFTIRGNARSDEYRVEIELLDNHRAAERDVRIEVRDGWSGVLLDAVSPYELASLAALPLESEYPGSPVRDDDPYPDEGSDYALGFVLTGSNHHASHSGSGSYVSGHAGATGPSGALVLLIGAALRRRAIARGGRRRSL